MVSLIVTNVPQPCKVLIIQESVEGVQWEGNYMPMWYFLFLFSENLNYSKK